MRRTLFLILLAASLFTGVGPAAAQSDANDKLSLESLTAPQPGDGQGRTYRRGGYHARAYQRSVYRPSYHPRRAARHAYHRVQRAQYARVTPRPTNQSPYLPYFYRRH